MFTSERFIMVLSSGVMNPAKQHASRTILRSLSSYAIRIPLCPARWRRTYWQIIDANKTVARRKQDD